MRIELDIAKTPFSLDHTLVCGQTFRWEKSGDCWTAVVGKAALKIRQDENVLEFSASSMNVNSDFVWRYFRLDDDLLGIYSNIVKDRYVSDAVARFRGLRLLRQEPWECLISFICATFKNIPAIKQMIFNLCRNFGDKIEFESEEFFTFPEPQVLANASVGELKHCRLGFRAGLVSKTAKLVSKGNFDLESLRTMSYEDAKKELLSLPGVGPKVADCVLLFALDKLEAFPIDVWMKRIFIERYQQHFKTEFLDKIHRKGFSHKDYQVISDFGRKYFGEYTGYAQEYLYHHKRCAIMRKDASLQ